MRTHTAAKSWFYSLDFRIRSSFSATINVRAAISEFCVQYSCTYYRPTVYLHHRSWFILSLWSPFAWLSREPNSMLGMVERVNWACSFSRNFAIFLTLRVFGVMWTRSVKHREFSCRDFLEWKWPYNLWNMTQQ